MPSASLVHILVQAPERHAQIAAATIGVLASGSPARARLEEVCTKLLLAPMPRDGSLRVELGTRPAFWEVGRLAELLARAETQRATRVTAARRKRPNAATSSFRRWRANALAHVGALTKAASTLVTEIADIPVDEQRQWANDLLPESTFPDVACSLSAQPAPASDDARSEAASRARPSTARRTCSTEDLPSTPSAPGNAPRARERALDRVRFAALSALVPSGARREQVKEILMVRRRAVASQLPAPTSFG